MLPAMPATPESSLIGSRVSCAVYPALIARSSFGFTAMLKFRAGRDAAHVIRALLFRAKRGAMRGEITLVEVRDLENAVLASHSPCRK